MADCIGTSCKRQGLNERIAALEVENSKLRKDAELWREHCDILREGMTIEIAHKSNGRIYQIRKIVTPEALKYSIKQVEFMLIELDSAMKEAQS